MSRNLYLLEAAIDSLGIYPAAVVQDGVKTPRDRYGDGWNEAIIRVCHRHSLLIDWYVNMGPLREILDRLFETEMFNIYIDGETIHLWLRLNDVFVPAADSKEVNLMDMPILLDLYTRFDIEGLYAWASKDYTVPPRQGRVNESRYQAALKDINGS